MNPIEKGALVSAISKGKVSNIKQGMQTSLCYLQESAKNNTPDHTKPSEVQLEECIIIAPGIKN